VQLKQLKVLKNLSCDSDFLPRFVARRYQRVLLVADETIEDLDGRLAAELSGGKTILHGASGGLADGGDPSVAEMLNQCARRSRIVASKSEVHKFSSRPGLRYVFSVDNHSNAQLQRRLRAISGEHMNDKHAKRGRFGGIEKVTSKARNGAI
jgi:hypothetical protein